MLCIAPCMLKPVVLELEARAWKATLRKWESGVQKECVLQAWGGLYWRNKRGVGKTTYHLRYVTDWDTFKDKQIRNGDCYCQVMCFIGEKSFAKETGHTDQECMQNIRFLWVVSDRD